MYSDFISFQALRRPHAIAVSLTPRQITYAQLEADINRAAHALIACDLPPAQRIAVASQGHPYQHWLVLLALARLGHISCSFSRAADLAVIAPDTVIAFQASEDPSGFHLLRLDEEWWLKTLRSSATSRVTGRTRGFDPARIILSSGTTGTPKKVLLTHDVIIRRVQMMSFGEIFRGEERSHVALGPATAGGLTGVLRTWSMGGAAVLGSADAHRLLADRVTGLLISPAQLAVMIDQLEPDSVPLPLEIRVTGSAVAPTLSTRTRLRLAGSLTFVYGSTETGIVASGPASMRDRDATVAGILLPGSEAQAVTRSGEPLPQGETGEMRIRNGEMVQGYLEDEAASQAAFRDGWFYPGDLGAVTEAGLLHISGRASEVMNIGGLKASPETVEHRVAACPGVRDVAAFSVGGGGAAEQLWLAVVPAGELDLSEIERACRSLGIQRANVIRTREIPRNEMGKIDRPALAILAGRVREAPDADAEA